MTPREEADHLVELVAACDRVLPDLGENTDELTVTIRLTCEAVDADSRSSASWRTPRRQTRAEALPY